MSARLFLRGVTAGFGLGALVLGLGGRALMRAVALATHGAAGFSVGGSLEVVSAGALYGAAGGLLVPLIPARLGWWGGPIHAAVLFAGIGVTSDAARGAAASIAMPGRLLALAAFGGLLVGYSLLLVRFAPAAVGRAAQPEGVTTGRSGSTP